MTLARSVLLLLGLCAVAAAQSPEVTREFQAGVDAFRLGKLDEARTRLEKARVLDPKLAGPNRFLAAVAQAQARWPDCIASARRAIALNPRSSEIADTRKLHDDCRASAGRAPYRGDLGDSAAIAVTTSIAGATVKINGLTYGGTPIAPRPITPGPLVVDIEKPGWKSVHVDIEALPGVVTDVTLDLEVDPKSQPAIENGRPPAVKTTGWLLVQAGVSTLSIDGKAHRANSDGRYELAPGTYVVAIERPKHDPWRRRVRIAAGHKTQVAPVFAPSAARESKERIGLALVGSGGAVAIAGFAAFVISGRASAEAREIERVETARPPGAIDETNQPLRTRADFEDARSRARRWAVISNVAYGAAAVTAGIGVYYLVRGAKPRGDVPPPFAIAPVAGGAFVAMERAW